MFYETFDGFGKSDAPGESSNFVSSLIAKAGDRQKRKRQEETFKQRKEQQEEAKKKRERKQKKPKAREVRDETLEERNSRKLAAKLARKKNKESEVVTQQQLVDALAVKQREENEEEVVEEEEGVAAAESSSDEDEVLPVPDQPEDSTKMGTEEEGDDDEDNAEEEKSEVPEFYKELNFAHEKNLKVKVAQAFEDEDDARMEINSDRVMEIETTPISLEESAIEWAIQDKIKDNLQRMKIYQFFPVQRSVIPAVIRDNAAEHLIPRDMCISAPTGSGKTLAYVVPIVQTLMKREITRLAALVLLPSRELAVQVHKVFESVARDTRVKTAIVTGQRSFAQEQESLVGKNVIHPFNPLTKTSTCTFTPCYMRNRGELSALIAVQPRGETGRSVVDVLVSTPGRLLDHLEYTAGFTLQHVRFLILDEADRLLNNAYHNWVRDLVSSIDTLHSSSAAPAPAPAAAPDTEGKEKLLLYRKPSAPLQRLLFSATLTDNPAKLALLNVVDPLILRCAAAEIAGGTAATDEAEADKEGSGGVFTLPPGLSEAVSVCTTAKRPALLASLLTESFDMGHSAISNQADSEEEEGQGEAKTSSSSAPSSSSSRPQLVRIHQGVCALSTTTTKANRERGVAIIFTASVDTAHRLSVLLRLFNGQGVTDILQGTDPIRDSADDKRRREGLLFGGAVVEMSRNVAAEEREQLLAAAERGLVAVIVATDNLARGIDLPNLRLVINYDPPQQARTYVHRVGRTARAGESGAAVTMLKSGQVGAFRKIRAQVEGGAVAITPHMGSPERLPRCKPLKGTEEEVGSRFGKAMRSLAAALGLQAEATVDIGE